MERLSLANYQKRVLFEEIARLISDPDLTVRKQAVKGLSTLGFVPEEIYGQIQEQLLAEGKADAAVLSGLFAQMVQSDQKAAVVLMEIITDHNQDLVLRQAAYDGLAQAVPQLEYHLGRGLVAIKIDGECT